MTRKGFRGVNIYQKVYEDAEKFIWRVNGQAGYRKIRSMAHLVELALEEYLTSQDITVNTYQKEPEPKIESEAEKAIIETES